MGVLASGAATFAKKEKENRERCLTFTRGHITHRDGQGLAALDCRKDSTAAYESCYASGGDSDSRIKKKKNSKEGKRDNSKEAIPVQKEKGRKRKKKEGKGQRWRPCFLLLISRNSPNHNDRRRALDGESEQGKGEIWAHGRSGGGWWGVEA